MEIPNARQFHIHPSQIGDDIVHVPIGALYRQMLSVLRLHKGDSVRFFDGLGNIVEAEFTHAGKDGALFSIRERTQQTRRKSITLAIAILKNDRMRWVLEKATELSVAGIIPMLTERVVKRPTATPPRWHIIMKEAAEQSGHAWLPTLAEPLSFKEVLALPQKKIVCSMHALHSVEPLQQNEHIVLVGPEGGFTEQELEYAEAHGANVVSLGEHQLRADTAAVVDLARLL
ncbi:16S rRNA (uracil(1498)-N(3))-methyltransferase [Candidatus Uhrbacteria bacterium]|nr:16S rRNA (uracil(1498)-N(3))-methyltransferase [Candidatus Uhrbacteria bacterium]